MIAREGARYRLAIPLDEALAFALGWSDLGYENPKDSLRQVVGLLAIDALEYSEQWRAAGWLRECMREQWPEF
jgi:hypothetical protein